MKSLMTILSIVAIAFGAGAASETVDGVEWLYTVRDGVAVLGSGSGSAFTPATTAGGDLVIPSSLGGYPVGVIGQYSFYYGCSSATSIVIPSSVTNIESSAFNTSFDTSLKALTNLVIPASVKTVGESAFYLYQLPNLTVRFESLKAWCEAEKGSTYGYGNPMYCAKRVFFDGVEMPKTGDFIITEGVERIAGGTFCGGSGGGNNGIMVTNIVFPSSLREIGPSAFNGFYELQTITIPASVQKLGTAIFGTWASTQPLFPRKVILPADFPFVENLAAAFSSGLKSTPMISGSLLPNIQFDEPNPNYLRSNDGLYSADGTIFVMPLKPANPSKDYTLHIADSVIRMAEMACYGASWIKSVVAPEGVTDIPDGAFALASELTSVTLGSKTRSIGNSAFWCCSRLAEINLPVGIDSIGDSAFYYCSSMTSLDLPDGVEKIGTSTFSNCSRLKNVGLPTSLREVGARAFSQCSALTSLELPDGTERVGESAFERCSKLSSVRLSASLKTLGPRVFSYCTALRSIQLPNSLEAIPGNVFTDSSLVEVIVPDSVTSVAGYAFYYCTKMTNVVVGTGVPALGLYNYRDPVTKTTVSYTGSYPFYSCAELLSVRIRSANTILGKYVFRNCPKLKWLSVPAGTVVDNGFLDNKPNRLTLAIADGETVFDANYLVNAQILKTLTTALDVPPSCMQVEIAALNQLVNLTTVTFRGDSFGAVSTETLVNLKASGIEIAYVPEGGTAADGEAAIAERLSEASSGLSSIVINSSAVREDDASVLDVSYTVTGSAKSCEVRSLAFQDGERSFSKVIRPVSFLDGTAANANGTVAVNGPHAIAWKISDDWDVNLGYVALEVMTVEAAELPLKLVTIPAIGDRPAMRFSCNALTDAKVLDALFWHYAAPGCSLTLADGKLYDGSTLLADGTVPTAAGTAYVFRKMGFELLTGAELRHANDISRLALAPEGARQYAVEHLAE